MILLLQDIGQGPVAQTVDIAKFTLSVEDLRGPFSGHAEVAREGAQKLDDLSDVVVVFAVLCAGLRVEEVVTCDEFKDLVTR